MTSSCNIQRLISESSDFQRLISTWRPDQSNRAPSLLKRRPFANFLGVGIEAVTYEQMEAMVDKWLSNKLGRSHHIACINAYCVTLTLWDRRLRAIYNSADLRGADGVPFVWWLRRFLKAPSDRITGPEIIWRLMRRAESTAYTFYLYGGAPEVVAKMKERLEGEYPYIRIVGYYSPPFRPLRIEEDEAICAEINRLKPDILLVGLGTPKQDYWIEEHLTKIPGSIFVAVGAAFDFLGGRIALAPQWIRESGFEWLYRLFTKDFCRLWRRYTVYNAIFLWSFLLQLTGIKVRRVMYTPRPE